MSPLIQSSAALPQTNTPVPSSSTGARRSSLRRAIQVVIPSVQAMARAATPVTPGHGHSLIVAPSPAARLSTLDTPTHGHGDFVVPSSHDSPLTPTLPRMSARATRRSGLFSASSATDADVQMHSLVETAHAGLMTPPMEDEELSHTEDEDEHSTSAESSVAGSAVDDSDEDAP
ncbi:uncharacterized protein TRAVEDRAFT_74347 [Trametes versicolor FP-101664 SS1]|uniref:uncharacterized protein n=1 Tax=Trametes versicolor (strain FP-101664) TaxID=717944 RepID=UPI0004622B25|nr:uncharacterized protein TRAVEDRAFT_74347 [Trametes versicolor FP-101664 SS1]EIW54064.1 hypothetical protein TRAVEDRAFT_74347 [Trametes versicolor FP-101664 SS1]